MEEYKNNEDRNSVLLEGMYNGVAGKIEEVRQSVKKELQYNSAQQVDAYDALTGEFRSGIQSILSELRYISQQNSAICDYDQRERAAVRDCILEDLHKQTEAAVKGMMDYVNSRFAEIGNILATLTAEVTKKAEIDYDAIAEKVAEKLAETRMEGTSAENAAEMGVVAEPVQQETPEEKFDYDVLAEKIASILPETDYDVLAEKVAATLPQADETALAERIAESMPAADYDLLTERVAFALAAENCRVKLDEESIESIAVRVVELLRADDADLERLSQVTAESEALVADPVQPAQTVLPNKNELAAAVAAAVIALRETENGEPAAAPGAVPPDGMTTRYKRSFVAKIIESEDDVKDYYSELKNALLGYQKANSQISWSNDRFTLKGETVAKIGIRGRTLCLYLALNPDEFPTTVYHQKFAGDTKMYEKTPMMVKIKSGVALKRAIRLVELLMEKNGAVAEERAHVDYTAQYVYRSEQELLAEGLIKTAIVEKSDLDF